MYKTNFRTGSQPGERQKCDSVPLSKSESQRKAVYSVSQGGSETRMQTSKAPKVKKCKVRAAPEIRHNLASKLRLVKSNPLLEVSGAISLPPGAKKSVILGITTENMQALRISSAVDAKPLSTAPPKQDKNKNNKTVEHKRELERIKPNSILQPIRDSNRNKQRLNDKSKPLNTVQQKKEIHKSKIQNTLEPSSSAQHSKGPVTVKPKSRAKKDSAQATDKKILQRTVTFMEFPRKSTVNVRMSRSASDLPSLVEEDEDIVDHKVFVKTPIPTKDYSAQRKSLIRSNSWRRSMYAPMPKDLRESLERWLKKRGKTFTSFSHLHQFGLKASDINPLSYSKAEDSDILNTTFTTDDSISQATTDNHQNAHSAEEDKENIEDSKSVVEKTLRDLLNIINMGYPHDRCEGWLQLIQKHFYNVREAPTYWECRAALEESSHHLKAAIGCYEQAIIKGAAPDDISRSLNGLMEKFEVLHLDPEENMLNSTTKATQTHMLDARNIFKSSIIKFALQQRKDKRPITPGEEKTASSCYVATPVRRSARISLAGYSSTPKLCVSSLSRLEVGIREQLVFKPNSALVP